ncbi:MAG: fumarate reductase flavoprotein subunit, partial [Dehalococcoidia bacterium]|nr:fumarate reductase flavoprotein subunit [Dehalococcoidia bacterium]
RTDIGGRANGLSGLYAAGEAACWDMHGFNRLGGNSVAETIVMGAVVGEQIAQDLEGEASQFSDQAARAARLQVDERIRRLQAGGTEYVYDLRSRMSEVLNEKVGIFRNGTDLAAAVEELRELYARSQHLGLRSNGKGANPEISAALRLPGMLRLALSIAYGALQRAESRGSHYREDYPQRDDERWLKRTLATWSAGEDLPTLDYEPVVITELPPGSRGYGEQQPVGAAGAEHAESDFIE